MNTNYFSPLIRFNNKVEYYNKYRPKYPNELIDYLNKEIKLNECTLADIGAGTGIFTKALLKNGSFIYAVEPNEQMRSVLNNNLSEFESSVKIIASNAERTNLESNSIDVICSAQAFHWFNPKETAIEFERILKVNGSIVLIWNQLKKDKELSKAYVKVFGKYSEEFNLINHDINSDILEAVFPKKELNELIFDNPNILDKECFLGRMLSSSFAPTLDQKEYNSFLNDCNIIFEEFQSNGKLCMEYETILFLLK